jgi:hypothetical protein
MPVLPPFVVAAALKVGALSHGLEAARAFNAGVRSIEALRKRLVEEGLDAAIDRKKQALPSVEQMFDGEKEAK